MLTDILAEAFAVLLIFAAGGALFYGVVLQPARYLRFERLAYCYPLGMTALAMPMFVLSCFGFHLNPMIITVLVVLAWLVVTLIRGKESFRRFWFAPAQFEKARQPLSEFEWLMVLIIFLCIGARVVASLLAPLNDWDGVTVWGIKAKILYYSTVQSTDYFTKPEYALSHQNYPLLMPLMYAWVCKVIGRWDDLGMLILNPINVISFIGLLYATLRRSGARTVALGVTAIAASLPAFLHYAECGQADVPLMLISGASLFCLFDWMRERRSDALWLAAFLMGGALFTKQEGKIILISQFCAGILSVYLGAAAGGRKKYLGQMVVYGGIAVLWALPWLLFERGIVNYSWDFAGSGISTFRWNEIPTLIQTIVANVINFHNQVRLPKWNFLWPILALALLTQRGCWRFPWICLLLVFILHASAIAAVFLASHVPLTMQAMEIAFERFTLVMLPPLWLILAKCANDSWMIWKESGSFSRSAIEKVKLEKA